MAARVRHYRQQCARWPLLLPALLFVALAGVACAGAGGSCDVTVSPGPGALRGAQLAARAAAAAAAASGTETIVCLEPGAYTDVPLVLVAADTPPRDGRVVWRSLAPGAAALDGGTPLTGWAPATYAGAPAFVAALPPGIAAGAIVRQLWVGGARAARVSVASGAYLGPLTAWYNASTGDVGFAAARDLPAELLGAAAATRAAVELTWPMVMFKWNDPRCPLAAVAVRNLTLAAPCGRLLVGRNNGALPPAPVAVVAPPGVPLPPGAFFHDVASGRVFYALAAGQAAADLEATAVTSFAGALLTATSVARHTFQGVAFAHATWAQPNTLDGYVDNQATVCKCSSAAVSSGCSGGVLEPPGAVALSGCTDISLVGCAFAQLGAAWAVSIAGGSRGCAALACNFTDLSGGAVRLGSTLARAAGKANPLLWDADLAVADCSVSNVALEYAGAPAIFAGYLFNASIEHNAVRDAGYTGVSLGWGWGIGAVLPGVGANAVVGNRIERVLARLVDGGGIYLNGHQRQGIAPSLVARNYVSDVLGEYAALYLDNGASGWLVADNVVANSPLAWAFFMQGCCSLPAYDSTVTRLWWQLPILTGRNKCAATGCIADGATLTRVDAGAALPPEAQAIKDASGPRPWRVSAAFATQTASVSTSLSASPLNSGSGTGSGSPSGSPPSTPSSTSLPSPPLSTPASTSQLLLPSASAAALLSASAGASALSSPSAAAPATATPAAGALSAAAAAAAAAAASAMATVSATTTAGTETQSANTITTIAAAVGGAASAAIAGGLLFYALVVRTRAHPHRVLSGMRAMAAPSRSATKNPLVEARGARIARITAGGTMAEASAAAAPPAVIYSTAILRAAGPCGGVASGTLLRNVVPMGSRPRGPGYRPNRQGSRALDGYPATPRLTWGFAIQPPG